MTQSENWLVTELIPRKLKIFEISRNNISIVLKYKNNTKENFLSIALNFYKMRGFSDVTPTHKLAMRRLNSKPENHRKCSN